MPRRRGDWVIYRAGLRNPLYVPVGWKSQKCVMEFTASLERAARFKTPEAANEALKQAAERFSECSVQCAVVQEPEEKESDGTP